MIIAILTSIVIILFCLYLVVSPFLQKSNEIIEDKSSEMLKEQFYAAINELEMDYYMEKISKDDFLQAKAVYESFISDLMKQDQKGCFLND